MKAPLLQRLRATKDVEPAGLPACVCALVLFGCLHAEAQTWDGSSSPSWTDGANWVGNTAPADNAVVVFNDALSGNLANTVDATFLLNSLMLGAAQTAPVTITTTTTNNSVVFNPGTVVTVKAGSHTLVGPIGSGGTIGAIAFTNTLTPSLPTLTAEKSGNVLTLSWVASSTYRLQAQTNGVNGSWYDYPGGSASPVNVPIYSAGAPVYYRLSSIWPYYAFDIATGASFEIAGRMRRMTNAGVLNYVKDGGGILFLSKDNGGGNGWMTTGDTFTVNQGILKMDNRARGNSGMQLVVKNGATLQVVGEQAIPNGAVTLSGTGVSGNGAIEFVGGVTSAGAGTNRIETGTVILGADAAIGVTESGQLNKCGLSGAFTMIKVGAGELELGSTLYTTNAAPWAGIVVSNGTLKVSGAVTYTTPVRVASGAVLRVTASFGSIGGPVTVQAGGKLEGTGTLNGAVTVDGELAPGVGTAVPGTLTINNTLTLNAGSSTTVQVAAASNDQVVGLTSVAFGGTLNVSDISLGGITPGQTFQLFNIGGSGNFTVAGAPSIGGTWSFNPATGVLSHVP